MQGVVTYMSRVEAFVTGIQIESSDRSPFRELIKRSSSHGSQARPDQPQRRSLLVSRTGKEGSGDSQ